MSNRTSRIALAIGRSDWIKVITVSKVRFCDHDNLSGWIRFFGWENLGLKISISMVSVMINSLFRNPLLKNVVDVASPVLEGITVSILCPLSIVF